jgi:hypothetical protein
MSPEESGLASGINNTFRQIGTALGIALLGAVLQAHLGADLALGTGAAGPDVVARLASGRFDQAAALVPPETAAALLQHAPVAFASGLRELFAVMAGVAAAGMAGPCLIRSTPRPA